MRLAALHVVARSLVLAGCWLGVGCGGPRAEAEDPSSFAVVESPPWMEGEGDAIDPRSAGPLSLRRLLAYADAHAPALQVELQQAGVAEAEVEGAGTHAYNPELSVSAGGRTDSDATRFAFGAELEQRIEISGKGGTRVEAAERARDAARARLDVVRWEVHAEAHGLYYRVLAQGAQIAAAKDLLAFAEAIHAILQKRIDAGEESPLAVIVAQTEIAQARQTLLNSEATRHTTQLRLAELIGWPAEVPLRLRGKLVAPRAAPTARALAQRALQHHPSRRWLELQTSAAVARVDREDRAAWPDPSIAVSYEYEPDAAGETHVWLGTLSVPLPIWERNQLGRARARAEAAVARAEQAAFEGRLLARIATAVERVNAAAEVADLYRTTILPAFKENLAKLSRAFELGEIDVLELSQIRGRILAAQNDALAALAEYYAALAELEALAGSELWKEP